MAIGQGRDILPVPDGQAASSIAGEYLRSNLKEGRRSISLTLAGIIALAVALRLVSALYQGDTVAPLPGIADQITYDTLARQVLAGHGFSFPTNWWPATRAGEPTAHWSFLYTLYLTVTYALFGLHPLAARLIEAIVVGILHPWLTWRIGARIFGPRIGLIAAGLSAVYAYFAYYGGSLMTEAFYILAILWAFDLATGVVQAMRTLPKPSYAGRLRLLRDYKQWLLLGVALGLAALLRQEILLFVPVLFVWLLWTMVSRRGGGPAVPGNNRMRRPIMGMLITTLVLLAMIAPWTARNYRAFGRFVLLNTSAGYAFFWANNPIYGTEFVPLLPNGVYYQLIPPQLRTLDEAAMDQALLQDGLRFVIEDPWRYAQLSLSRIKVFFNFWPEAQSSAFSNLSRVISFGILLPAMLYGVYLSAASRGRYVRGRHGSMVVLLYLFAVVYSLIHLLSWALIRYRLPVDSILLLFAALAIADLGDRIAKRSLRVMPGPLSHFEYPSARKSRRDTGGME